MGKKLWKNKSRLDLRLPTNTHNITIKCYVPLTMNQNYLKNINPKIQKNNTIFIRFNYEKHGLASMNKCEENLQISVLQTPKPSLELALILPQDISPGYMYLTKLLFVSYQPGICISQKFSNVHNMIADRMGNATSYYHLLLARVRQEAFKHLSKHLYWIRLYHYNTS